MSCHPLTYFLFNGWIMTIQLNIPECSQFNLSMLKLFVHQASPSIPEMAEMTPESQSAVFISAALLVKDEVSFLEQSSRGAPGASRCGLCTCTIAVSGAPPVCRSTHLIPSNTHQLLRPDKVELPAQSNTCVFALSHLRCKTSCSCKYANDAVY